MHHARPVDGGERGGGADRQPLQVGAEVAPASCREGPSTYSVTMYGLPLSDASSTWAMQNGSTLRAAAISLAKRSSPAKPSRSVLTATGRPSGAVAR
ncbi:hypothetical protein [Nonomuraea dietziae]|uniref:hypothetical protein n=1 Tax=Nonomuraea dietziae TaxID=65515 RepID=UPI0031D24CD8